MAADLQGIGTGASVVGLAAKGAGLAGVGTGTAVAAAIPVIGWAAAAVSLAATIFGGKSEGYAAATGYEIKGNVRGGAFTGAVTGLTQNPAGTRYRISEAEGAYGERAALNTDIADWWNKYFPDNPDLDIPINITLPYDWSGKVRPAVESIFKSVADQRAAHQSATSLLNQLNDASSPGTAFNQSEYDRLLAITDANHRAAYGIPLLESPDKSGLANQLAILRASARTVDAPANTASPPMLEAPTLTNDMPAPVIPSTISVTPATGSGGAPASSPAPSSSSSSVVGSVEPIVLLAGLAVLGYLATR